MRRGPTIVEVLSHIRNRRRRKRCADCGDVVTIQGLRGEYWWSCLGCDAMGIGYSSRSAAIASLE